MPLLVAASLLVAGAVLAACGRSTNGRSPEATGSAPPASASPTTPATASPTTPAAAPPTAAAPSHAADPWSASPAGSPAEPAIPPATPEQRMKDPAFALRKIGDHYVGRVAAQCPWGRVSRESTQTLPSVDPKDYKLVDGRLEIVLPYGGCPRWAGYTVVTGHGSPLPFYICAEVMHDPCELAGSQTWVFDISKELRANHATAVAFGVPDGVH